MSNFLIHLCDMGCITSVQIHSEVGFTHKYLEVLLKIFNRVQVLEGERVYQNFKILHYSVIQ